jgi:hypothetical protein
MMQIVPNLFVIGVPKAGTTTLHGLLEQHPQIYMSSPKEPRFFSRDSEYAKGLGWYLNRYFSDSESCQVRGEATPTYLTLHEKTIPRIRAALDGRPARFIAIFRNPVDRAYSHYWFNRNSKTRLTEDLSFENALAMETTRMEAHPEFYEEGIISRAYFRTGLYAEPTRAFIEAFGRENCLLLLFEDLFFDRFPATVQVVERFLSVASIDLPYAPKKQSARFRSRRLAFMFRKSRWLRMGISRFLPDRFRSELKSAVVAYNTVPFRYPEMNAATRQMLLERYRPGIAQFAEVIGRDLSHWQ